MASADLERLARTAYEARRAVQPASLPPWEETTTEEREAGKAAVSAIAGPRRGTRVELVPVPFLLVTSGAQIRTFHTEFTAGAELDKRGSAVAGAAAIRASS